MEETQRALCVRACVYVHCCGDRRALRVKKKTMQKLPASAGDDIVLAEKERASREVGTTMYVGDRWLIRRWQCTEARFAIRWLCWWVSHLLFVHLLFLDDRT